MGSRQLLSRLEALLVFFRAHVEQRMPLPGFLYTYPLLIVTLLSHFCAAAMPNPSSYKLRRYEPSDKTAVIQLFCDNIREEWGERYHRGVYLANAERYIDSVAENECSDLNNIEGVYFAKGGYFWVLTAQDEDDAVVGCCGLEVISESEVELRRMCISRNHRQNGCGSNIMIPAIMKRAKAMNGVQRITLSTPEHGTDTVVRFYKKNKFVDILDGDGNPKKALNIHGTPIHEVFLEYILQYLNSYEQEFSSQN